MPSPLYWVLILIIILIFFGYSFRSHFLMNDVTTTPNDPPQFETIEDMDEDVRRNNREYYGDLAPLKLSMTADQTYALILDQAKAIKNWDIIRENPEKHSIEAVATTPFMRFKDDIVIEIRQEKGYSTVHMRSKSRVGKGDFGTNAMRIKLFFSRINEAKQNS